MFINVAIDVPLRRLFTYDVPEALKSVVKIGSRVLVPFGCKTMIGICLECDVDLPKDLQGDTSKIKAIKDVINAQFGDAHFQLSDSYLSWLQRAASYYQAPLGQVLAQAIPKQHLDPKFIAADKMIRARPLSFDRGFQGKDVILTDEQQGVVADILAHQNEHHPVLIHGVTGSGKTEIYINVMKDVLAKGKAALFLVPEIGLTPQMLARLHHHFKDQLLVYHSGLTQNQRFIQWNKCLENKPVVMVGTRSALFVPLENLGVIVIDEEHDGSYKQEDRFRYHARDVALLRASMTKIPIILGSATPSLESFHLSQIGALKLVTLKSRHGKVKLPKIRLIDFTKEKEQTASHLVLSQAIHDAIDIFHQKRKQMMIFVGQRGFAQNAYCMTKKEVVLCPNCDVSLTYHKPRHELLCHYCGYEIPYEKAGGDEGVESLTLLGFGTQTVEEEIQSMHPKLVVRRVDSDVMTTSLKTEEVFQDFQNQKINLLIGTQMIAKGHDFGNVGFVGVVGVDAHLGLPDFRANERAYQTIVQVSGRAGRSGEQGHVVIQSHMPDHPSVQFAVTQDHQGFLDWELKNREALMYPPFAKLVQIRFLCNHKYQLESFLQNWSGFLIGVQNKFSLDDLRILGPADMPLAKVRGKYRMHVLFKIRRGLSHTKFLSYILDDLDHRKPSGIQYQLDVDAKSLL